jgi:hypothetical protein
MVAAPCQCGQSVDSGIGNRAPIYICCVPLKDPRSGRIVGYGAEQRPVQDLRTLTLRSCPKKRDDLHVSLTQIEPPPAGMTTALYERFDKDGVFLYVGVSDVPVSRGRLHLRGSTWFAFAASGCVTWFPSRAEAEAAERLAISTRRPLFNRLHAQPGVKEELVRYLIDKGRLDLLDVTAKWG